MTKTDITASPARCAESRRWSVAWRYRRPGRAPGAWWCPRLTDLGHDAGVPGAARGGDGAGDVVGEDPGQDDPAPPLPAAHVRSSPRPRLQVGREGAGAGDDVEQDVPLGAEDHQRADSQMSVFRSKRDDHQTATGNRADWPGRRPGTGPPAAPLGQAGPQADPDADRHPDQAGERDQDEHPHQGDERRVRRPARRSRQPRGWRDDSRQRPAQQPAMRPAPHTSAAPGASRLGEARRWRAWRERRRRARADRQAVGSSAPAGRAARQLDEQACAAAAVKNQDFGAIWAAVCSKRNLSAQATSGRNSSWS